MISRKGFFENLSELFTATNLSRHEWIVFKEPKKLLALLWYIAFVRKNSDY